MSVSEMRVELMQLVAATEDEKLLQKILDILNELEPRTSIENMYAEAANQYGNTLRKLAQ